VVPAAASALAAAPREFGHCTEQPVRLRAVPLIHDMEYLGVNGSAFPGAQGRVTHGRGSRDKRPAPKQAADLHEADSTCSF
jgi:hypothetical protein